MIAKQGEQELRGGVYEPTSKDIRRACEEIQATWSPRERAKRYRGPSAAWRTPPSIRLSGLIEMFNEVWADSLQYFGATGDEADR